MITNIETVISMWNKRYEDTGFEDYRIVSPGYSDDELTFLEQDLGLPLHYSLRTLLLQVKLDAVTFSNLGFGFRYLSYLADVNRSLLQSLRQAPHHDIYLQISSSDGYSILTNNTSGAIYAYDDDNDGPLIKVAGNPTEFICLAATITCQDWPDKNETIARIRVYLTAIDCLEGLPFWSDLALGWA